MHTFRFLTTFGAILFGLVAAIRLAYKLYIAVIGDKVLGKSTRLSAAKAFLRTYPDGATEPIRMIAEAIDNRVNRDPRTVGGRNQSGCLRNGFNIWWNTWDAIERLCW